MIERHPPFAPLCLLALFFGLATVLPQAVRGQAVAGEGGEPPKGPAPVETRPIPGAGAGLDPTALARSIDHVVEAQLKAFHLPGAAVVVVHRGQVLHSRGYGYADTETGRRFDSRTVFRTASVSKTINAMAVMRLVEQGLMDLDEDVGTYIDVPVPATYPAPITMRHLLTHTAGFDDRMLGSSASQRQPGDVIPLREFLTRRDAVLPFIGIFAVVHLLFLALNACA